MILRPIPKFTRKEYLLILRSIANRTPKDGRKSEKRFLHILRITNSSYLGGEHSVSVGAAIAYHEHYADLSVLQFDAHSDLRDEYEGSNSIMLCNGEN